MYWGNPSAGDATTPALPWREGHATAGAPELSAKWAFAEGREGIDAAGRPYSTFFLLSNPSSSPLTVKATFMTEDGGGLTTTVTVPANGRTNIWPTAGLPAFQALANRRFATFLESTTAGRQFVAERAVYLFGDFSSGHVNMGTPWSGAIAAPATAPGAVTVSGFTPSVMRLSGGEAITITGTGFSTDAEVTVDGIAATVTSATSTSIVAVAPLRTATTGFGTLSPSTIRLTASGATRTVGTIGRVFRVLAIGDSFTEGQLVERIPPVPPATEPTQVYSFADPPYPEYLESILRSNSRYGSNADVDNEGFSGECASIVGCSANTTRGVGRIGPLTTNKKYDVVIILEGFNDLNAGATLSQAVSALRTMGQTARASGATVLMGRIHVMRSDMWEAIRTMALEEQFTRVDFGTSVEIGTDGVHPTQDGYDLMAEIAYAAIRAAVP
jgi:lysophospholipase L1-like esterase